MKTKYDKGMGYASVTTDEGQTVYSLLCNPGTRTPAINASTLAAYSRSAKAIPELLEERRGKGIDGAEVIDKIISTYNHPSVMGLGHLSMAVENIDCITAMQFFYNHHLQDGQERSTRYQNFSKGRKYAPCPIEDGDGEYHRVLNYWLDGYEYLYPKVKEHLKRVFEVGDDCPALNPRTLDCVRYLVPMGVSTSIGAIQNGREWSKYISYLHSGGQVSLAQAMELVLRDGWDGYTPEGDVLIKYTEPWESPIEYLNGMVKADYSSTWEHWPMATPIDIQHTFKVYWPYSAAYFNGADPLLVHLYLLNHPHTMTAPVHNAGGVSEGLTAYSWKHEMGPIGSSGIVAIHGMADLGTLKDLNRHRSSPAFIPLLHNEEDAELELQGRPYTIHPYLKGTPIGEEMCDYIDEGYRKITTWVYSTKGSAPQRRALKNLLPHAHVTPYVFYGSPSTFMTYICNLRARPGGHMAYRQLAHAWAVEIGSKWPLWEYLVPVQPTYSREEFIDRS